MGEIVNGNALDKNQSKKAHVKVTNFKWVKDLFGTYRFGEIGSIFVFNGKAGDKRVKIRQNTDVESYSMQAPLMTAITMNKTYFQIPRQAIIPKTWEKIFTNPSIGEDIDASNYGTSLNSISLNSILQKIKNYLTTGTASEIQDMITDDDVTTSNISVTFNKILQVLCIGELFLSNGSLINAQGAHLARLFVCSMGSYDKFFEWYIKTLFNGIAHVRATNERNNKEYIVTTPNYTGDGSSFTSMPVITLRELLEEYRDGESFTFTYISNNNGVISPSDLKDLMDILVAELEDMYSVYAPTIKTYSQPFDTAFAWAYQLSCAEFFTNDKVDYIYNAELFRQYIGNLYMKWNLEVNGETALPTYTLNGVRYEADYLSAIVTNILFNAINFSENYQESLSTEDKIIKAYIFAMLKYNRSLKYKDYFTGARTRPIAIDSNGYTSVSVNDDIVEVIDISKGIQAQRFVNVVNKIPRDIKGFTKGIFGVDVAPDWHNPLYLARVSSTIYGQETENTGDAQLSNPQTRTTVLKNAGGNIQFEFKLDRNSIIIGVVDFDIPRAYSKGVNRMYMEVDRFDMFNPYMQYTGDQEVYGEELDVRKNDTFAYQGAYMHMKQDYNEAFGGFIEELKGWTFLDQYVEKGGAAGENYNDHVSPDFIRSKPSELDRFYISLTGMSMASYFHFIIKNTTSVEAVRPMAYNPQILG